jgi:hypothetical protein
MSSFDQHVNLLAIIGILRTLHIAHNALLTTFDVTTTATMRYSTLVAPALWPSLAGLLLLPLSSK